MELEDVMRQLEKLPPEQRVKLQAEVMTATKNLKFIPNPGPQRMAYITPAEVLLYGGSGGAGKQLDISTPIPTPDGFKNIGDIVVGDYVMSPNGKPVMVVAVSEIDTQSMAYAVEFDSGEIIYADERHLWVTLTEKERLENLRRDPEWQASRRARRPSRAVVASQKPWVSKSITAINQQRVHKYLPLNEPSPKTTAEIQSSIMCSRGRSINHSVDISMPFDLPERKLPIEPYLFGMWLGDGMSNAPEIGMSETDFTELMQYLPEPYAVIKDNGSEKRPRKQTFQVCRFDEIRCVFRDIGLRGNKHIPQEYLRASFDQRLELLRGLMDTDGTVSDRGGTTIGFSNERLINDTMELISSLGIKCTMSSKIPKITGRDTVYQRHYTLHFRTNLKVFKLKRKLARQIDTKLRPTAQRRYIISVTPAGVRPMRCIQVENEDGLYLVGRTFVTTHNSALLTGLALTAHHRSLLLRRKYSDLSALSEDLVAMNKSRNGFTSAPRPKLRTDDGRFIEFGACQHAGDEEDFQGQAHDLKAFDEVSQFLEKQVRFIIGWNRLATGVPRTQRCRVVFASNPPTSSDGDWIIGFFRPWLDPTHSNPAKHGELRWFITTPDGKDQEVKGPEPVECPGRKDPLIPRSRTFIPGKLADNPFLAKSGYASVLDGLPEPLRSAIRDGNFMLSRSDDAFQCIPSDWVRAAVGRWDTHKPMGVPMCAIGCDPAQGGQDQTVLAIRYDGWFDNLVAVPGEKTPLGTDVAALLVKHRKDGAEIIIDMGGGYGSSPYDHLRANEVKCYAYKGAEASTKKDISGKIGFANRRSEVWWKFREALDPAQPGGSSICLPPDPMLISDLTAPKFEYNTRGIKVEPKEDVKDRLGRSTDKGDAVVLAWSEGSKGHKPTHPAQGSSGRNRGPLPQVVRGYKNRK